MKVLVTGSSGYIGSAVAGRLARRGQVTGIDVRSGRWTSHIGDVRDVRVIRKLLHGVEAVVHTAGLHVPHLPTANAESFRQVNVDATGALLEASASAGVRRFVLTSTTSVYGCSERAGPPATWVEETLSPLPADIYDETKLAAEALCRDAAGNGMSTVILRLSRCFPEPEHLVAFYRMYRGVDRRDAAQAHLLAALMPLSGSTTFNISAASPFERVDVADLWTDPWGVIERRVPGLHAEFERRHWPLPPRIDRVYSIDEARRGLGYEPRFGIHALLGLEPAGGPPPGRAADGMEEGIRPR